MVTVRGSWDGKAIWPYGKTMDAIVAPQTVECKVSLPRSEKHHNLIFAVVAYAFGNWPEQYEFRPESAEHLRAWFLCRAGHRTFLDIPLVGDATIFSAIIMAVVQKVRSEDKFAFPRLAEKDSKLRVYFPKSISRSACDKETYGTVCDKVVIDAADIIGMPPEDLKLALKEPPP